MRGRRKTGHRLIRIAAALIVVAAAVGAAALALPRIVEGLLVGRLGTAGIPDPQLRVADLGWTRATIADLRLGTEGELTADEVVLTYSPFELLRGRLDSVRVQGLRLMLRLDGEAPLLGSLHEPLTALASRPGGEAGATALPDVQIADGAVALAAPAGTIAIPVTGEITQGPSGRLEGSISLLAKDIEQAGIAVRDITGSVDFARPPGDLPRLSAHLRIADLAAGGATLEAASLDVALDGKNGTARIRMNELGGTFALDARAGFQDPYGMPDGTVQIAGHATAESALWRFLDTPSPTGDRVDLVSTLDGRLSPEKWAFAIERAAATVTGLAPAGIAFDTVTVHATAAGTPDDVSGTATLAVAAPELAAGTVRGRDLDLRVVATFAFADGRLTAKPRDGEIGAQRLAGPALLAVDGPVRLPLTPSEDSSFAVDFTEPIGPRIAYDLTFGPAVLKARLRPNAPEPIPVEAKLSALSLAGIWPPAEPRDERDRAPLALDLAAELAHRGDPAFVAPLDLEANGRLADGRLDFTIRASTATEQAALTSKGHHDLRSGAGAAEIDLGPIAFAPDGPTPEDLAPVLAGWFEQATGTVALVGTVSWAGRESDADLRLLLRDLSFVTPQAAISRINAVIAFDDLLPLATPPGQTLAIAAIDAGLPLTDGLATFRIDPDGRLAIDSGRLHFAGGTVSIEPVVLDVGAARNTLRLRVSDVALKDLSALADVEGLAATGRLDGLIPVRLGEGVVIENGVLAADGPGRLSYEPARPPAALQAQGETVSLLLSALTNFQYDELRLTVDRDAGGEAIVAIHIEGKNPDFYDGYPVELNFNISGKLDQVLHRGLAGYRIPEAIRRRLSEFPE